LQVLTYGFDTNGARTLQNRTFSNSGNGLLQTDDRGAYRIYGLRPGEYYVQATPASSTGGRATSAGGDRMGAASRSVRLVDFPVRRRRPGSR
jgi:hypothetical protein